MSSAPELHVVIPLEGSPRLYVEAETEGQELRLRDWLEAVPFARELVELAERWKEAA